MQTLDSTLGTLQENLRQPTKCDLPQDNPLNKPISAVAVRFWTRMAELYGSAWTTPNGTSPTDLWTKFLDSVSPIVIRDALGQLVRSGKVFPPHLPEFVLLCQHAAGYPAAEQAYRDAAHSRWTHPVVYETCCRVGHFEVRNRPEREILPRWLKAYAQVCSEAMAGTSFEAPARTAIDKPKFSAPRHEVVMAEMDKMRQMLGMQS